MYDVRAGGPKLARTPLGKPPLTPAMAARLCRTPVSAFPSQGLPMSALRGLPATPSVRQTVLDRMTFQVCAQSIVSMDCNITA